MSGPAAFAATRATLEEALGSLGSELSAGLTAFDLEEAVQARGREVMHAMMQDSLDLLAVREQRLDSVTGADEVTRTRAEPRHSRALSTVVGEVTVTRIAYRAPKAPNLHPADAALNLPAEQHSHGLRRLAAIESARGSFEQAGQAITRATGVSVGKRQVEQLAVRAAADIDGYYAQNQPGPRDDDVLLALQFDAKGVVMRREALRPATARAAASAGHKMSTRLSAGEKNGRKRMAEIAVCCDVVPRPRVPADIIRPPGKPAPDSDKHAVKATSKDKAGQQEQAKEQAKARATARDKAPRAEGKWLTASVTDNIAAVVADGFAEADRRDPGRKRTTLVLLDGNNAQIKAVTAEAARRGRAITILIDLVHVMEYVWGAAWSFYPKGDPGAEKWVGAQVTKILEGNAAQVAAGIRRRATAAGLSKTKRAGADKCANYLTAKAAWLDYKTALAAGWPIATGIVEGAARWLVGDRMDITGARWGLAGAEAVLKLRALIGCGDFDDYWKFHLRQEHQRVHQARYRDNLELAA